jgi:hypothetical protein
VKIFFPELYIDVCGWPLLVAYCIVLNPHELDGIGRRPEYLQCESFVSSRCG